MPDAPDSSSSDSREAPDDRLESWKEIAVYLRRDVTTVQRWEKREGMPVHRHLHDKLGSVHAFRSELDAWTRSRRSPSATVATAASKSVDRRVLAGIGVAAAVLALTWWLVTRAPSNAGPLADARFVQLTDFGSTEHAAAISADGRFVAFLSDRDGRMDVWVTQAGTGQFHNLTRGAVAELVNPAVRTLGFTPDGSQVTFWARRHGEATGDIAVWTIPVLGGTPRPYIEGAAEYSWSRDGRLVYHTPAPGDPMFVREPGQPDRQIYSAATGLHAHFPVWSPDGASIYFVQGTVPDHLDIWRVRARGGTPERITHHDALVSHPVFLDAGTLLYLAADGDGGGPWLYTIEPGRGAPRRAGIGLDRYTSLAANADGTRFIASLARSTTELWRVAPSAGGGTSSLERVQLATGSGSRPSAGRGHLLYVSSKGDSDSIWTLRGAESAELWTAPGARVVSSAAVSPDGRLVTFAARQDRRTTAYVAALDGTGTRAISRDLEVSGAPSWAPDGRSVTIAAMASGTPVLYSLPLNGDAPRRMTGEYATDPVWAPDGSMIVYSGPDVGVTFSLNAVGADGRPRKIPGITLSRGARRVAFMPGSRSLAVLRGNVSHKDLWLIDLDSGAERQLTHLPAGFNARDFTIAAESGDIVLERVRDRSDIVLIDRSRR